jgi:hypothetical protein
LAHPAYKNLPSPRSSSAPPNSASLSCSSTPSCFHLFLPIVGLASLCHDDLSRRPHALFSIGDSTVPSPSTISPSNGLNELVRASLADPPSDAIALPPCPVCGIASGKSCFDCEQQFCANHIYSCADCGNPYCGDCLDAHYADGHWSDSDTTFEFAASRGVVCASFVNSPDRRRSELTASQRAGRSSSAFELAASRGVVRASSVNSLDLVHSKFAAPPRVSRSLAVDPRRSSPVGGNRHAQASGFAIPVKLKSLLSQHLTRLAKLISFMVQNVALQSEAGS